MDMKRAKRINKVLKEIGGVDLSGNQNFRVVWSENEEEVRKGNFNDFYGKIFVRSYSGVRKVKKYSYIKEKWILERFVGRNFMDGDMKELPDLRSGTYEPIYVFQDKKGSYLPLSGDFAKIIVKLCLSDKEKINLEEHEAKDLAKEVSYFEDVIEDNQAPFHGKLGAGEGIIVP